MKLVSQISSIAIIVALAACQGGGSNAALEKKIDDVAAKQDKILAELAKVQSARPAAPSPQQAQPGRPDPEKVYGVALGKSAVKGEATAKITIIESSDFQCPFCGRVTPTIKQLEETYGKDLRVAFKHNPLSFHDKALGAATAAEAAGRQGKFWEMHDKLFGNQRELGPDSYVKWAQELGLDVEKFKKDLESADVKARITEDQAQVTQLGARGTPAFWINGRFLSGAQPFENFKKIVDEELQKANDAISKGTAADKYYDSLVEKGAKSL